MGIVEVVSVLAIHPLLLASPVAEPWGSTSALVLVSMESGRLLFIQEERSGKRSGDVKSSQQHSSFLLIDL